MELLKFKKINIGNNIQWENSKNTIEKLDVLLIILCELYYIYI